MLDQLEHIGGLIGNTPVSRLRSDELDLFVKLEYYNYTGSIKDRPAYNILRNAILRGDITPDTTVIESSSGNFAVSVATICAMLGIRFVAVIDPVINKSYERLLQLICYKVIKVTQPDATGGYLLNRLKTVRDLCYGQEKYFWTNQYENTGNYLSYYEGLGGEICSAFSRLDYVFIGVSTGGTITGLSLKLKERFPGVRIIAVDVVGSVIFGGRAEKRHFSGIGASIKSPLLDLAQIDEVVYVEQPDVIQGCEELLSRHLVFGGASTGAVYKAILNYFSGRRPEGKPVVLFLCTDKGTGYLDSVYDEDWKRQLEERYTSEPI